MSNLTSLDNEIINFAVHYGIDVNQPYTVTVSELPSCDIEDCDQDATYSFTIRTQRDTYNLWHACDEDTLEAVRQAGNEAEDDEEIVIEKMVTA